MDKDGIRRAELTRERVLAIVVGVILGVGTVVGGGAGGARAQEGPTGTLNITSQEGEDFEKPAEACPNENVSFYAYSPQGTLVDADWSGGDNPTLYRGASPYTTNFGPPAGSRSVVAETHLRVPIWGWVYHAGVKPVDVNERSGLQWVGRYPDSGQIGALSDPFRGNVERFVGALRRAGARVQVNSTRRPLERAYLMHYAFRIARDGENPLNVPPFEGVEICWAYRNASGEVDMAASRDAAAAMIGRSGYGIAFRPSLTSNHIDGEAIDMSISWRGELTMRNGNGALVRIRSTPRTGAGNRALWNVGASYGVRKLATDPPHWSVDGM